MIGLIFLAAASLWAALSIYIAINAPRWLGLKSAATGVPITGLLLALMLFGPFIDEVIGMRQFKELCNSARTDIWIGSEIQNVRRAQMLPRQTSELEGYFIKIKAVRTDYIDMDSGKPFLSYKTFLTKGGRVWGVTRFDTEESCGTGATSEFKKIWNKYQIQNLLGTR